MKLIEIFKPGRHTAMSGAVIEFSEADLKATADAYDPKVYEAPLVVGHPALDAPAYGWTKSLSYSGTLQAVPDQVEPAFAEMVEKGRFKKVSASFFLPNATGNPKPGVYYLRHIGFLGAQAPAVKGLRPVQFAGADEGVIEFSEDVDVGILMRGLRGLREWIIAKFGAEEADKAMPDWVIEAVRPVKLGPSYAEPTPSTSKQEPSMKSLLKLLGLAENATEEQAIAALNARDAKFAERETSLTTREQAATAKEASFAEREKQTHRAGIESFLEGLIKEGKVLPAQKAEKLEFMLLLSDEATLEFAEGDKKIKKSPLAIYKEDLAAGPKLVDYSEHSRPGEDNTAVSFAAPTGYGVDPARLELHNKALAWQQSHPNTTYDAALAAVSH